MALLCPRGRSPEFALESSSESRDASPEREPVGILVQDRKKIKTCQWNKRKSCTAAYTHSVLVRHSEVRGPLKVEYAERYYCSRHLGYLKRRGGVVAFTKRADLNPPSSSSSDSEEEESRSASEALVDPAAPFDASPVAEDSNPEVQEALK
jgi:hypothetical protein